MAGRRQGIASVRASSLSRHCVPPYDARSVAQTAGVLYFLGMAKLDDLTRWQRATLLCVTVLLGVMALAALAEGAVRVRHYLKYGGFWGIESTYTVDEASGLRVPVPGLREGSIEINSRGFRGPEIVAHKTPSTLRLAFLGGSTTYCAEVSSNELTWPHLVWGSLQRQFDNIKLDYINAGVPGYNAAASLKNLEYRVAELQPEVVVIYHATNDLSSNSYRAAREQGLVEEQGGDHPTWLSRYSLLWYLAEKNGRILLRRNHSTASTEKLSVESEILAEPFYKDLSELVAAAKRVAPVVVLVTFSHQLRHDQDPIRRAKAAETSLYYMPYMTVDGILAGFDAYNRVIREVASRSGAVLIDGETIIPADPIHFKDSVHFTDEGSRAMAARVVKGLLESPTFVQLVEESR